MLFYVAKSNQTPKGKVVGSTPTRYQYQYLTIALGLNTLWLLRAICVVFFEIQSKLLQLSELFCLRIDRVQAILIT